MIILLIISSHQSSGFNLQWISFTVDFICHELNARSICLNMALVRWSELLIYGSGFLQIHLRMHLTPRMMRVNLSEKNNVVGEISVDHPALSLKTDLQKW